MSTFSDLLSKAQQLEVEIAKEGTVLVGDAAAVLTDLIENLEHEVKKEVNAEPASTPAGEPTPNAANVADGGAKADTPAPGTTPEGSTTGPQPSDPATDNVNTGDAPVGEAIATPPADVQKSSDINGPAV